MHSFGPQMVAAGGGGYGGRLPARPRTAVFREAQKHVRARLEKKWLAEFISTPEFIDRNGGSTIGGGNREASKSAKSSKAFAVCLGYDKSLIQFLTTPTKWRRKGFNNICCHFCFAAMMLQDWVWMQELLIASSFSVHKS